MSLCLQLVPVGTMGGTAPSFAPVGREGSVTQQTGGAPVPPGERDRPVSKVQQDSSQ